ncbi:MAG: threonine synthase [Bacteroidetes bacterium]|nr:threonine synthase [Bacteroidota bacterium]MDA0887979.1 threonine synthase [Bacteroidota bacterium]MDA1083933.1 threonine synthase [Bacteroidota bacterium]
MKYYSLTNNSNTATFDEAVIRGLAPDRGLYFPANTERLSEDFLQDLENKTPVEIGVEVMRPFVGGTIPEDRLKKIVEETLCFDFPLVPVHNGVDTLELFHGPTMAFKDVGARFMARCIGYFNEKNPKKVTVLVATSGDTGGAVASGFLGIEGTEVIILYPKGKVSDIQELQLTINGNNIKAVEVDGVFDDCQEMVKTAFLDEDLNNVYNLTSANSINVARWLPQSLYFFFAYQQLKKQGINKDLVFSVPSGNFGNICAGIVANRLGLPIHHFVASTNVNDTVPRYLQTQEYNPNPSKQTISNAMDVGNPSNFIRIQSLYKNDFNALKQQFSSYAFDDNQTQIALKDLYENHNYVADPHGAVGYLGLQKYMQENPNTHGVFLETAHPIKFRDTVEENLKITLDIPEQIQHILDKTPKKTALKDYDAFKAYLLQRA